MGLSPRTSFVLKVSIGSISLLLTALYLFTGSSNHTHPSLKSLSLPSLPGSSSIKSKKALFIDTLLREENEIDGPFNNKTMVELCGSRQWTEGLIFKCEPPEGGIGNVRNVFLNCVRYAIEAGATAFIIPELTLHTTTAPKGTPVPFGHYFDLPHFTSLLSLTCPQITLIAHQNDLFSIPSTAIPVPLVPTAITTSLLDGFILGSPGNWSSSFYEFLNITHPIPPTGQKPVLVSLQAPLLQFPLTYDDPHFVASFGRILRFREDVRRVAAGVVWAMDQKHGLGLDPSRRDIESGKWYGAHLRTGPDAVAAGWTTYAVQANNYLSHALRSKIPLIYITSTTQSDTDTFTSAAAALNITVETKQTLLSTAIATPGGNVKETWEAGKGMEEEWALLQGLSWDQQLLVDYEVLLRSSVFGGTWESSYSWNVAMRRHVVVSGGKGWTSIAERDLSSFSPSSSPDQNLESRSLPSSVSSTLRSTDAIPDLGLKASNNLAKRSKRGDRVRREEAQLSDAEKELERKLEEEKEKAGQPATENGAAEKEGESSFRDALSFVFGPVGEGKRVRGTLWP